MINILKHLNIYWEKLDSSLMIQPENRDFWNLLEQDMPSGPVSIEDIFPETIGVEDELRNIVSSGSGTFHLRYIKRQKNFIHLNITPGEASRHAVIAIEDITEDSVKHQSITQKKNETSLLKRQLELKNEELNRAYSKLDTLMNTIRSQNHHLETEVRRRTKELNDSRFTIITTLAQAAEFRDMETGGHIFRIGRSSVLLGKKYGLTSKDCESLFYSSLLHDLGKIGIPDSILLKPGPLNSQEWDLMRQHTTIGASLLSNSDHLLFSSARDVALYHHEKWDGSGYPAGLSGEQIPLIGRICAIVDVFDALISARPYKKAFSVEYALSIIEKGSGSHFDPSLVKTFKLVLDDIVNLQNDSMEELEFLLPDFGS
ncbi:HD domain-containing protein [Oceanispirochaeta crateris]|uniref:HD domain-containing protein n=1 Tax=Oceanispirochaeta crateris TaxID=2518645 RepID=A0A5C1QLW7_9SPIO|nr:HD domain-containing phosphohydrolase [Oceanispirochaeta crateris]QEN08487.1 HD domain-containing protein [Oceanispirochaeta crateris]